MVLAQRILRERSRQAELRRRMIRQTEEFLNRRLRARGDATPYAHVTRRADRVARSEERRAW